MRKPYPIRTVTLLTALSIALLSVAPNSMADQGAPSPSPSATISPTPSVSPTPTPTPSPTSTSSGKNGIPSHGLGLNILDGNYAATSVASGTTLTAQIILSEKDITSPLKAETVVLTFTPDNGAMPTTQNVTVNNNFSGCGVADKDCYYAEEPIVVKTSGTMTLSYNGSTANYTSTGRSIDVWVPQARLTADQVDEQAGFQIHAVYVVPSDGVDRGRDTSGQISTWLEQGSRWLNREAKDSWQIDTFNGAPDITYFHSKYPTNILSNSDNHLTQVLLKEMGTQLLPVDANRKTYLFFIEVPVFTTASKDSDYKNGTLCGLSQVGTIPVKGAIIATGSPRATACSGRADIMDWQAAVATHETIHTFGVHHVSTPHDLMRKVPDNGETLLFDPTHKQYFGGNLAGTNLQTLRIWSKNPANMNAEWPCIYDDTTLTYWCGVGTTDHVSAYAAQCWKTTDSTMVLQVFTNNVWTTVSKGIPQRTKECPRKYPAAYYASFSSKTYGTFLYRFKTSQWTGQTFTVIYQL